MKYKIVQFKNGTYGLRRFSILGYRFKDLYSPQYEWWQDSESLSWIQGTLERVETALAKEIQLRDRGEIVKFDELNKLK